MGIVVNKKLRHSLRRAALRSAFSASRTVSTQTRIAPFAARAAECNAIRTASPQTIRFFSQTVRKASEEKDLEEAQRKSEEDLEHQVAADARQDVEVRRLPASRIPIVMEPLTLL